MCDITPFYSITSATLLLPLLSYGFDIGLYILFGKLYHLQPTIFRRCLTWDGMIFFLDSGNGLAVVCMVDLLIRNKYLAETLVEVRFTTIPIGFLGSNLLPSPAELVCTSRLPVLDVRR